MGGRLGVRSFGLSTCSFRLSNVKQAPLDESSVDLYSPGELYYFSMQDVL